MTKLKNVLNYKCRSLSMVYCLELMLKRKVRTIVCSTSDFIFAFSNVNFCTTFCTPCSNIGSHDYVLMFVLLVLETNENIKLNLSTSLLDSKRLLLHNRCRLHHLLRSPLLLHWQPMFLWWRLKVEKT